MEGQYTGQYVANRPGRCRCCNASKWIDEHGHCYQCYVIYRRPRRKHRKKKSSEPASNYIHYKHPKSQLGKAHRKGGRPRGRCLGCDKRRHLFANQLCTECQTGVPDRRGRFGQDAMQVEDKAWMTAREKRIQLYTERASAKQ